MTQIEDLQGRISRALDRIAQGADQLGAGGGDTAELEEQLARAQAEAVETRDALELAKTEHEQAVDLARAQAAEQARLTAEAEAEAKLKAAVATAEAEKAAAVKAAAAANAALTELRAKMSDDEAAQPAAAEPATESNDPFSPDPGIGGIAAAQSAPGESSAELSALREALEDEKMANAQLEERHRVLAERVRDLESEAAPAAETAAAPDMAGLDSELYKLRKTIAELEDSNRALREANAQGVGDPHLINKAMLTELESLRAVRASESAEGRAVLAALEPLLSEPQDQVEEAG